MSPDEVRTEYVQIQQEHTRLEAQQRTLMARWHRLQERCHHPRKPRAGIGVCPDCGHNK